MNQPSIPSNPLSYHDAAPILQALDGPESPRDWQGGLPFTYHLGGTGAVKVHMNLVQDYKLRTIWDVVGTIDGTDPDQKEDWVVAGNHRDAWVYGAVDPNSGTAAMLEAVHGLGELLKQGWKPKRRIVIWLVGCGGRRADGLDGVGRDARQGTGACGRLLQYRRGCGGAGLRCFGSAVAEGVCARRDAAGAEPEGRNRL